jgi:hypothetical protein
MGLKLHFQWRHQRATRARERVCVSDCIVLRGPGSLLILPLQGCKVVLLSCIGWLGWVSCMRPTLRRLAGCSDFRRTFYVVAPRLYPFLCPVWGGADGHMFIILFFSASFFFFIQPTWPTFFSLTHWGRLLVLTHGYAEAFMFWCASVHGFWVNGRGEERSCCKYGGCCDGCESRRCETVVI